MAPADAKSPQPVDDSSRSSTGPLGTETHPGRKRRFEPAFRAGDVIDKRFVILSLLGRGGMGEVYEADDLELHERVALKTIRTDGLPLSGKAQERFRREILLARKVTHVNVCRIFDFALHQGVGGEEIPFLSMELLRGETLSDYLLRRSRLATDEALVLVRQIAAGLSAAHQAGIVHRDFKSANVILASGGDGNVRAVVTDFGLAHSTESGAVPGSEFSGTPAYMAPEQVEGRETTTATDVYALGIVMYEMVTGALPFAGSSSPASVANQRLVDEPPPPSISVPGLDARWEQAILKCLERDPAKRFATVEDVVNALSPPIPIVAEAGTARMRPKARVLLAAGLLASLGAVAVLYTTRPAPVAAPVAGNKARRSLAVLGFSNLSGRPEAAWLSTALSEMLTTDLAASESLRTVPGESIRQMKIELTPMGGFGLETMARIRRNLGTDLVVSGSYFVPPKEKDGRIRIDIWVQQASDAETILAFNESGSEGELLDLVGRFGTRIRLALGEAPLAADQASAAAASRPASTEAARLYAEGLVRLRQFDARGAKERLEAAVALDPQYPHAYSALSLAWSELGHDEKAQENARRALELSGRLSREEKLLAEARYAEANVDRTKTMQVYERLFAWAPDDLEYGLRLVQAHLDLGDARAAQKALDAIGAASAEVRADPRVLLSAARIKLRGADPRAARDLAAQARRRAEVQALDFVAAQAALTEASAAFQTQDLEGSLELYRYAEQFHSKTGNRVKEAEVKSRLAEIASGSWDLETAERLGSEVVATYEALGSRRPLALVLTDHQSVVYRRRGQLKRALEAVDRSERVAPGLVNNLWARALYLFELGQVRSARTFIDTLLARYPDAPPINGAMIAATVLREQGEFAAARAIIEAVNRDRAQKGSRFKMAWSLSLLASIHQAEGRTAEARELAESALGPDLRGPRKRAIGSVGLASILLDQGDFVGAHKMLDEPEARFRRAGAPNYELNTLGLRLRALLGQGERGRAEEVAARMRGLARSTEDVSARLGAVIDLARLSEQADRSDGSLQSLNAAIAEAQAKGYVATLFEGRLVRAMIQRGTASSAARRRELEALIRDADARGFGRISQETRKLLAPPAMRVAPPVGLDDAGATP
jgi:eukaryotic-like serine/threonine-protein kinase